VDRPRAREQHLFARAPLSNRHSVIDRDEQQAIAEGVHHCAGDADDRVVILTEPNPVVDGETDTDIGDRLEVAGRQVPALRETQPAAAIPGIIDTSERGAQRPPLKLELLIGLSEATYPGDAGQALDAPVNRG